MIKFILRAIEVFEKAAPILTTLSSTRKGCFALGLFSASLPLAFLLYYQEKQIDKFKEREQQLVVKIDSLQLKQISALKDGVKMSYEFIEEAKKMIREKASELEEKK